MVALPPILLFRAAGGITPVVSTVAADLVAGSLMSYAGENPTGDAANPPGQEAGMQTRQVERRMHTWASLPACRV